MKRILTSLVCLALSASYAASSANYIGKDGFVASIVGKSISSKTSRGNPFTATFKRDGTGDFKQKGKKAAHFNWTMEGTTVCWDFGDFKECNKVELVSPTKANFYDSKTGKLNNVYSIK